MHSVLRFQVKCDFHRQHVKTVSIYLLHQNTESKILHRAMK